MADTIQKVTFTWLPGHIDIVRNCIADKLASTGIKLLISDMLQGIDIPIASDSGRRVLVNLLFTYGFLYLRCMAIYRTMNSSQAAVLLLGVKKDLAFLEPIEWLDFP